MHKQVQAVLAESAPSENHALFIIDADNFKQVNDTYGHQAGDRFLAQFGQAISRCFRETDLVGRIGGDEFWVLMKHVPSADVIRGKADTLLAAIKKVFEEQMLPEVSGSIGISFWRADGETLEELYQGADRALYQAKRTGKNRAVLASECRDTEFNEKSNRFLKF